MELRSLIILIVLLLFQHYKYKLELSHEKYSNDVAEGQKPITLYATEPRGRNDGLGNREYNAETLGSNVQKSGSQAQGAERLGQNAGTLQTESIPDRNTQGDLLAEQLGDSDSQPLDAGLAKTGGSTDSANGVSGSVSSASGKGAGSTGESVSTGLGTPSATRKNANAGNQPSATDDLGNYAMINADNHKKAGCIRPKRKEVNVIL